MDGSSTRETDYQALEFAYRPSPDQRAATPVFHDVVIVGAGPVGLSLAIDLAQRGIPVLVLDDDHRLSSGSRAICFAKRTLEIFDRLGCGERVVRKGVSWSVGKVFFGDEALYRFDLTPDIGHSRPAFVNLQQYYVEGFLAERAFELPNLEVRWKNRVVEVTPLYRGVALVRELTTGAVTLDSLWSVVYLAVLGTAGLAVATRRFDRLLLG